VLVAVWVDGCEIGGVFEAIGQEGLLLGFW